MEGRKRLIINADDMGLSRGITEGIIAAHWQGVVTSTSLLVNQPETDHAVEVLRQIPELGVGIHLNISEGTPVLPPSKVPTLVTADGHFHGLSEMARRLSCWQASSTEIEAEFRAQIQRMKRYGITPTHADCHHDLHLRPCALLPFRRAVLAEGIRRMRPPRRYYYPPTRIIKGRHNGAIPWHLLVVAYMKVVQSVLGRKLLLPDGGIHFLPEYRENLQRVAEGWALAVQNMPEGTYELGCHPGFSDPQFSETPPWRERRELELRIVTDPELRSAMERAGITLISYRDVQ